MLLVPCVARSLLLRARALLLVFFPCFYLSRAFSRAFSYTNKRAQSFRDADVRVLVLDGSSLAVDDSLSVVQLLEVISYVSVTMHTMLTHIYMSYIQRCVVLYVNAYNYIRI